ncbi:hypothetical protein PFISCL1PPCAC_26787 [Pristionchus fissidentatus]|uniref:Coiled-coil domain-containing protein 22 homolog n=1 Tax=Pristionchus fissidentatus TaxID=1538716 RepID=A0AAV5WXX6_9BILA|nr:hypothetical protein PFISCL1PPCAC_26787 [Pristionchus fissidentatus]
MSSSEELERHLRTHFDKLECSFLDDWTEAGGELAALNSAQCFEAIVRLLWRIRPALQSRLPSFLLPPSATARFRMATLVAEAIKEVGVREKLGFQTLLYGSGKELSSHFIQLLQLVPRDGAEEEADEEITFHDDILHRARLQITDDLLWVPEFCRALKLKHDGRFWCPNELESEVFPLSRVFDRSVDAIIDSSKDRRELAAALYMNDTMVKESLQSEPSTTSPSLPRAKPALLPKPSLKSSVPPPVEDEAARIEREEAERELSEAMSALNECRDIQERIHTKRGRLVQERLAIEAELESFNEKLMTILEEPDEARLKIEKFIEERDERVHKLESRWETARGEKIEELRALREQMKNVAGHDSVHDRLRRGRVELERLEMSRTAYERRADKLAARSSPSNDDHAVNRHLYVKKLLEVTGNLKKQREELNKVWRETDMLLKDIKWSEQAATRTFDLLEDILYKKTDLSPKDERVYRHFVTMYNKCQLIVKEAENIGSAKKRKEELVDKVDIASSSSFSAQLSPMVEDLASIEEENRRLEEILANA